jgi:hypothetical protein
MSRVGQPPSSAPLTERELRDAAREGRELRCGDPAKEDVAEGYSWPRNRIVCAEVLYELLTRPPVDRPLRAVILTGVLIKGPLSLEAAEVHVPLILHHCYFDGPVNLNMAQAPAISLTACYLPALAADQLETRGNLELRRFRCAVISLNGAHIGGQLSLKEATLTAGRHPIDLGDTSLYPPEARDGPADRTPDESADEVFALAADSLTVDGSMRCEQLSAMGKVHLPRANIGGLLNLDSATLTNRCGEALRADRLRVEQGMFCRDGFNAEGEVRLPRAHIGGQLSFKGAKLRNRCGTTLYAHGLRVEGSMHCDEEFAAEGKMLLTGAHIGGQLSFKGARLRNECGPALIADRLSVDQSMFCDEEFAAEAAVLLPGAHIDGQLSFAAATLRTGSDLVVLDLEGAEVRTLVLRCAAKPVGTVNLTDARIGRLRDKPYAPEDQWPLCRLDGCQYQALEARPDVDVNDRLKWVGHDPDPDHYSPQPYTQLMEFYRQEGRDRDARRVAYERERWRLGQLGLPGKAWNGFLRWTVGYGYKPLRALGLLVVLVVIGALVFSSFHSDGDLKAVKEDHPPFVASIYTLDRLIPVVSFGLRDAFAPSGAAQWLAFAYTLLGWTLTIAVVAGLNAAVRRD